MSRLEFSTKTRKKAITRAGGKCEKCGSALKVGEAEVDHILPCALGGEPSLSNAQVLCRICHREKTASDVRRIRKADRQSNRHTGAKKPSGSIKSRGFDKQERSSKPPLPPRRLYEKWNSDRDGDDA